MTQLAKLNVRRIGYTVYEPPVEYSTPADWEYILTPGSLSEIGTIDGTDVHDAQELLEFAGRACYQSWGRPSEKTATNAGYLAHILEVGHFSILEHASVTFYVTGISRSLTHELIRHRHLSYSQLSQRYVAADGTKIVIPPAVVELMVDHPREYEEAIAALVDAHEAALNANRVVRDALVESGVKGKKASEAARAPLGNMVETQIIVTGNHRAWINFLLKRDDPAADAEIARLARAIGRDLAEHAPHVFGPEARAIWQNRKEV